MIGKFIESLGYRDKKAIKIYHQLKNARLLLISDWFLIWSLRHVSAQYPNNIKPAVVIKLKNNYQMCVLLSNQP